MNESTELFRADEPVRIALTEAALEHIRIALECGLEAAEDCHEQAVREYGQRKPLRIQWYAQQVAKVREGLWELRQQAPSVFPSLPDLP